jgi:hypothetical protein
LEIHNDLYCRAAEAYRTSPHAIFPFKNHTQQAGGRHGGARQPTSFKGHAVPPSPSPSPPPSWRVTGTPAGAAAAAAAALAEDDEEEEDWQPLSPGARSLHPPVTLWS